MPVKRGSNGADRPTKPLYLCKYRTEYLPDIWLAQYEDEPPGQIRAVKGDLTNCYIKKAIQVPVFQSTRQADGSYRQVRTGTRTAYIWVKVEDE